jgi:2-hydroxycyclohexanecarboxyl-CoA dehydrogenase
MAASVALITGGSSGIGFAVAQAMAKAKFAIAITARDQESLDSAAAALTQAGASATCAVAADLRDPAAPFAILAAVNETVGHPDVLVNNAGSAPTARFERTSDAQLDEVLDLHVRAPFRLIRTLLPSFRDAGKGCFLQVASTAGLRAFPYASAYTAAKHAMVGMTRALAAELEGTKIGCYAICPGFVDTKITRAAAELVAAAGKQTAEQALAAMGSMNRIGRMHTPAEVAKAILRIYKKRPDGVVMDLDTEKPTFV